MIVASGTSDTERSDREAEASGFISVSTSHTNEMSKACEVEKFHDRVGEHHVIDAFSGYLSRLRKNVGIAARLFAASHVKGTRHDRAIMVTLTYAGDNSDWRPKHIAKFTNCLRMWCKRHGIRPKYVWVGELQKRGVIHYHIVVWLPKHLMLPKPDKQGWWPHGMSNVVAARKPVGYLMKYLSKDASKSFGSFPNGCKKYGIGGLRDLACVRRWFNYPRFIQCIADVSQRFQRVAGGGWADADGVHYPSEYEYAYVDGKPAVRRVYEHEKLIEPDGAFCWIH